MNDNERIMTIMVVNAKGGAGKTTLATNLAGYYASQHYTTALKDYDPQGSSRDWLEQRPTVYPTIHGIPACETSPRVTRAWSMRLPPGTQRVVVDTPAAVDLFKLASELRAADAILVPVMASPIDIRASAIFFNQLQKHLRMLNSRARLAVVASRVVPGGALNAAMGRIFSNLSIPVIASLRQSDYYIQAAERGISLFDMDIGAQDERRDWQQVLDWLEQRNPPQNAQLPRFAVV